MESFGFLVIDKPSGVTSHDVVSRVRKILHLRQVGHLGTLDPMATGVLPLACGKATRLIQFIPNDPKIYTGTIRLGFSTTTYDREGEPTSSQVIPDLKPEKVWETVRCFLGKQIQVPPAYSAKKIKGRPSYRLARKGEEVRLASQQVRIDRFEITLRQTEWLDFEIHCSPGTYIRSIANDLGIQLGCGAHLISLRRERSGIFDLKQAVPLPQLEESDLESLGQVMISPGQALKHLPSVILSADKIPAMKNGQRFQLESLEFEGSLVPMIRLMDDGENLLGLATLLPDRAGPLLNVQPKVVLV